MMGYVNFRLRAPTEDAAKQAAASAIPSGFELVRLAEDGETWEWVTASLRHAFDPGCPGPIVGTEMIDAPGGGQVDAPVYDTGHWYANLAINADRDPDLPAQVETLLSQVGAPLGVEIVADTGREWA